MLTQAAKNLLVMLFYAAFSNTIATPAEFGGTHAVCLHPAPLLPLIPQEHGWERGLGEQKPSREEDRG